MRDVILLLRNRAFAWREPARLSGDERLSLKDIVFIDAEAEPRSGKVVDIGAVKWDGSEFHANSPPGFTAFLRGCKYVCGHNILRHDAKLLKAEISKSGAKLFIDTLYLSPLLFPKKPYHKLVKDDKLVADEMNNPLNDAKKARDLLNDEISAFYSLDANMRSIYSGLLRNVDEFKNFFRYIGFNNDNIDDSNDNDNSEDNADSKDDNNDENDNKDAAADAVALIRETFKGKICANAKIETFAKRYPIELAYAIAQISVIGYDSITPPWVLRNYSRVENILHVLRSRKCKACDYCDEALDEKIALKRFFHYDTFRSFGDLPLQHDAVKAASNGKSILVVFPTGGGKSITFQLPALMAGDNEKGLTVVISPLQSLMKDQTDTLEMQHNITAAVTINGSLDPVERGEAFKRVEDGSASLLYISPESLRSRSLEMLLLSRNIVRFVIDEAHCFSTWGQDFRVDYLYIGDFIRGLQEQKGMLQSIPVSCFTATAKKKVIADIKEYFKSKLSVDLEVFKANPARENLSYHVFAEDSNDEKDKLLRQLLQDNDCPAIIYVATTRHAEYLAAKLTEEGLKAKAYHGRMDSKVRTENQNAFMRGEIDIIVATTAFGMGVDKKDVGMVIHYNISDSLENYIQEAGRAGRDESIMANCYILFADEDLNRRFIMLNQSKLTLKEIRQVWRAIKTLTGTRESITRTALEIARASGWDDSVREMETRIRTSISALEQSGFVRRGQNMPRIFADSIMVHNMEEAKARIDRSSRFDDDSRIKAGRIMSNLISARSKARGANEEGEARVDYISDRLGIAKDYVIRVISLLREEKILADAKDLSAYIKKSERGNRSKAILETHGKIEEFLIKYLQNEEKIYNIKEINDALQAECEETSIYQLRTIINYFAIKHYVKRTYEANKNFVTLKPYYPPGELRKKSERRRLIAQAIIDHLFQKAIAGHDVRSSDSAVEFSVLELKEEYNRQLYGDKAKTEDIEDALYYLLKIDAIKIEGGFLVIYNAMRIERLETDNKAQYKKEHYEQLEEYYRNKTRQIHIVGEYARRLIDDYGKAMEYSEDYFVMDYDEFLGKYFDNRQKEINMNITPEKYERVFGELSSAQHRIIKDQQSKVIVVAAGPGSGKTKLLTHKLASLYMMEEVKHEQMLMLTFSRAAATEFKTRLMTLIGNAANFIQIMTFHSYCFDLLGRVGDIEKSDKIIERAVEAINEGEVDSARLTKMVLVIDEAQDISAAEYTLVKTLMKKNGDMRVIAVGDDDQNIYTFRGSSSDYFKSLLDEPVAKKYELVENYRSSPNIVDFANQFAATISRRFKSKPIVPRKKGNGEIVVCKPPANGMTVPVVNAVVKMKPSGSTCIVTRTNDEAFIITGLLLKEGVYARQIQSNNDFNLANLVELRDLIGFIDSDKNSYTINDDVWVNAKKRLNEKYGQSDDLRVAIRLMQTFESVNTRSKYKSDLKQFIRESKLEDFISESDSPLFVSTIHQTKGREFDNVFLALDRTSNLDDAERRAIYVAITRAKQNLYIFCNGDYFDGINVKNIKKFTDNRVYPEPSVISIQLTHKDVFLSYFARRRGELDSLISGQKLAVRDKGCFLGDKEVVRFSASFSEKLETYKAKGYSPAGASIRHIVFWQDKDNDREIKIILPNLELTLDGDHDTGEAITDQETLT